MRSLSIGRICALSAFLCLSAGATSWSDQQAPSAAVIGPPIFDDEEVWVSVGPRGIALANNDVISGQVNAIAVHPTDANTLYIGASEGGVWKTTNTGGSWTAVSDFQLTRALPNGVRRGTVTIGSVAIDPNRPDTVYAGTGDPNVACCPFLVGQGLGVFRSTDGGQSWTPTGASFGRAGCQNEAMSQAVVNRILVRPGTPTLVFAATNIGVFRYRDDGSDCWSLPIKGLASGNATDLVVDSFQGLLYAAISGQGIFRSLASDGAAWTQLIQGLPTSGFGRIALAFAGRTGVGFSRPSRRLYAGFAAGQYRLFHTADGGDTWSELPSPPTGDQLGFNNAIAVGTYSADEVYVGHVALRRATDGGKGGGLNDFKANPPITGNSWTDISCCLTHPNPFRKGLDLHADVHDIVFAPYGSFTPTPSETQIVFVATDGGVTKGSIDFEGVVNWTSLTKGLAIAQCGSFGLHPNDRFESACGVWHNGNALLNANSGEAVLVGFGDGFNTSIDAATPTTVYFNCNAVNDADLCRAVRKPGGFGFTEQKIWDAPAGGRHWSDPYRPGHLLNLQAGLLFRTTAGNTVSESGLLNGPDAWVLIEPPGKSGKTTTMAFRSWVLEEQPVYYLGTDTGQIWRGSPEAGWLKLCECGAKVNGIGPDLFRNERIYAVFNSPSSPGRIKQLARQGTGAWVAENIDTAFNPTLRVTFISSVAAKPVVPFIIDTTVYVGTDQGMYRGHLDQGAWSWTRAAGVPNVVVSDVRTHQSARFFDLTQIVRASTYGRGIYELRRSQGPVIGLQRFVEVHALRVGEDGAPASLTVSMQTNTPRERTTKETPFELAPVPGFDVSLEAPAEVRHHDAILAFAGWAIDGGRRDSRNRITLKLEDVAKVVAYYELKARVPSSRPDPLKASLVASARDVCVAGFSHELTLSWEVAGGQAPVSMRAYFSYPDKSADTWEPKPLIGSREIPVNFPAGGRVAIRLTAEDSVKGTSSAQSVVALKPCR